MPNTMTLISSTTVGAGGAANVTFSSIPSTYTDLQLLFSARDTGGGTLTNIFTTFNGNTSGVYNERLVYQVNLGAASASNTSATAFAFAYSNQSGSNVFSNGSIYITNYAGSTNKSLMMDSVTEQNTTTGTISGMAANSFSSTSAISSINLTTSGSSFVQYASFYLYGIVKS
jgi:hypothetical protein